MKSNTLTIIKKEFARFFGDRQLLFTTVIGLYVNARMPLFTWKSDTEVVKQSGAVLIMILICFGLVAATAIPMLVTGLDWIAVAAAAAILLTACAVYGYLMKNAEQIRRNL